MQLENSHGGYAGRSLVNVMQETLDKTLVEFEEMNDKEGVEFDEVVCDRLQGMVAGMAKMIGIIRGTSVQTEIQESRQRIRERQMTNEELSEDINAVGVERR